MAELREKLFLLWGDLEERKLQEREGKVADKAMGGGSVKGNGTHKSVSPNEDELPKPAGRPFQCCIKEYGVRVNGEDGRMAWERRFRMFGTTIT